MTRPQEASFRKAAAELDGLLATASDELLREGLSVVDESARTYHYKNPYLSWGIRLSTESVVGYERAKLTVWLSCNEPVETSDLPKVTARTVAEIFQIGQLSRVREVRESDVPWEQLRSQGLAAFVVREIRWGRETLSRCGSG